MTTNKYINLYNNKAEQTLVDDLIIESIKIHGIDCYYLPREVQKLDLILGEDVISKFTKYYSIESYVKNIDGFQGQGTIFRKFGVDIQDQLTLWISRSRFAKIVGQEMIRPKEGDLIYFPINNAIFEIKFVEHESIFYNIGEFYVYELQCEQYVFENSEIVTGIDDIDDISKLNDQTFLMNMGTGSGTYSMGETVYQGTNLASSSASAEVISYFGTELKIRNIKGKFSLNTNVIGNTSGATRQLSSFNEQNIINDFQAENDSIETAGDTIIDFTEKNPFGEE